MKHLVFLIVGLIYSSIVFSQRITQSGIASYYADKYEGKLTANGEKYRHSRLTAAHKTLPFGSKVKVTNTKNNKSVVVRINDRGPFVEGRIIDLSKSAAEILDFINAGLIEVTVEVIDPMGSQKSSKEQGKPNTDNSHVEEKEFYDFGVSKVSPAGFGVQIGTYSELINLVRLTENLNNSYQKNVIVQVSVVNQQKVYRIIIGNEKTRKKAERLKTRLRRKYPDSFIVDFKKL